MSGNKIICAVDVLFNHFHCNYVRNSTHLLFKVVFHLFSCSLFDIRYSKYYKLDESTMSPSSIALRIFWKQQGHSTLSTHPTLVFKWIAPLVLLFYSMYKLTLSLPEAVFLGLFIAFLLGQMLRQKVSTAFLHSPMYTSKQYISNFFIHQMVSWIGYSEKLLRQEDESEEFDGVITMLTLLFNKKQWKKKIEELLLSNVDRSHLEESLACSICVLYVCLGFLWSIVLSYTYVIYKTFTLLLHLHNLNFLTYFDRPHFITKVKMSFLVLVLLAYNSYTYYVVIFALQSFLLKKPQINQN